MIRNIFGLGRMDDDDDPNTASPGGGYGSSIPYPPYRPGIPVNTAGAPIALLGSPVPTIDIDPPPPPPPPPSPTYNEVDKADPTITIDPPIDFENGLPM